MTDKKYKYIKNSQGRLCLCLDYIPKGWKPLLNTNTAPKGYTWYWNGEGLFEGLWESALIKNTLIEKQEKPSNV